jgi:hypothetical protein
MTKPFQTTEDNARGYGYLPGIAIDAVIFGFHENQLKVLLMQYKQTNLFALPGGFVQEKEDLNQAAYRVVSQRTGLHDIFLDQFYVFGDFSRFDPEPFKVIFKANNVQPENEHWLLKRFISVGYYALVDFTKVVPAADQIFDGCDWYNLYEIPELIQDHSAIIKKALETLRINLDQNIIGFNLLPEEFTMGDLQKLYETIQGKKLLRAAFQRKILGLNIVERMAKKWTGGAHKAPYLYRFKSRSTVTPTFA